MLEQAELGERGNVFAGDDEVIDESCTDECEHFSGTDRHGLIACRGRGVAAGVVMHVMWPRLLCGADGDRH